MLMPERGAHLSRLEIEVLLAVGVGDDRAARFRKHRRVLDAVARRDGPGAEAAIREHITDFQTRIKGIL